ncbi:hypothetical protein PV10_08858 [Exophiala mesophila]|uniref:Phytase-like domain-containing protein n=1 Tax=Exophiala mesophila TaxID=212818 RepID=A0A0D1WK31_EXOME|nr:uncharacterized protein PV10_08858 [Exophiala mesophila]KIV89280.1 hypothetical protein PV10_08858 [Exophiala mesophila]
MLVKPVLGLLAASFAAATPAPRAVDAVKTTVINGQQYVYESLAGYGYTPANSRDKFGDTAAGLGSSAVLDLKTWTKDKKTGVYSGILWALPDRGWNTEGTLNYQPRLHKFSITFNPNYTSTVDSPSKPNLHFEYLDSILFTDPEGTPITGIDADATGPYLTFPGFPDLPSATYSGDGFGGEGPGGHRVTLDPEGLVLNADKSFWVSDEYGPYIYHFSPEGQLISAIRPPPAVIPQRNNSDSFSANSSPRYDPDLQVVPAQNPTGRANNQGLEGLTASPDGKTLYALLQSALDQDGGLNATHRRYARFLEYDVSDPANPIYKSEHVVPLPRILNNTRVAAQSAIHYLSPTRFLVLSRDSGRGHGLDNSNSTYRQIDIFDISNATDIKGPTFDSTTGSIATNGTLNSSIIPATYDSWINFNLNSQLNRFGLHNGGEQDAGLLNEKWESIVLAPVNPKSGWLDWKSSKQSAEDYFVISLSDNDFITQNGFTNGGQLAYADESGFDLDNQALVFKVKIPSS